MRLRLLLTGLLLGLVLTGVEVSHTAHEVRHLHTQLEDVRQTRDAALTRHSQLLLEVGAVASLAKVQDRAEAELAMQFPDSSLQLRSP